MSVREVYGRILRETKLSGRGRRNYETPFEYAGRLETSIPGVEREVDDITDLYVKVRYGESEVKSWETEHANVIWRLLYRVFHSSDKEKK